MFNGLFHTHEGLAYLLLLSTGVSAILAIVTAIIGPKGPVVKVGSILGRFVESSLIGLIMLVGIGLWWASGHSILTWWLWASLLIVIAHEGIVARMGRKAFKALAKDDESARYQWLAAALVKVVVVYGLFGIMEMLSVH